MDYFAKSAHLLPDLENHSYRKIPVFPGVWAFRLPPSSFLFDRNDSPPEEHWSVFRTPAHVAPSHEAHRFETFPSTVASFVADDVVPFRNVDVFRIDASLPDMSVENRS